MFFGISLIVTVNKTKEIDASFQIAVKNRLQKGGAVKKVFLQLRFEIMTKVGAIIFLHLIIICYPSINRLSHDWWER